MPETLILSKITKEVDEEEKEKILETTTATTPRSVIIIPRSKSQAASRRIIPTDSTITTAFGTTSTSTTTTSNAVEKHLPNGDLYIGNFSGSSPHGSGKYLWKDGCMYEGEWKRGKASGKGKFSWPSGATFEGEFKSGRMEGSGTFIGSDGDMYKGSWSADRKHGYGQKHYSNGDYYEGHWKRNLQDGQGRYVWKNGNEYVGEWKNGDIHGRGVLIWANGNRYDGNWESGVPKGHGVFTWPDGSCYIGCWTKNQQQHSQILNGTFYPANNNKTSTNNSTDFSVKEDAFLGGFFGHKLAAPLMENDDCGGGVVVMNMGKKRSSVDGARGSMTERNFPRICIWESDGEAGDITCDIIDNVEASMIYRDRFGFDRDGLKQFRRNPCCFSREEKKPGQTISKGHKNYDLMLNLQLGIR